LLNGKIINKPELIFPFSTIQQQLARMYQNPTFEANLRHWTNQPNFNELCDIYNGDV
jgi:hypothetical protein